MSYMITVKTMISLMIVKYIAEDKEMKKREQKSTSVCER